jgi:hypothetical protein
MKIIAALILGSVIASPAFAGSTAQGTGQAASKAVAIIQNGGGSSGGSSEQTIHNTPDVSMSSYAGGANPCGVGGSLGATVAGFGMGGSIATEGHDCTMRSWFVLLASASEHAHNPAYMQWAVGVACANADLKAVAPPGICPSPTTAAQASTAPARPVFTNGGGN